MKKYLKFVIPLLLAFTLYFNQQPPISVDMTTSSYYYSKYIQIKPLDSYYDPYNGASLGIGLKSKIADDENKSIYLSKWSTNYGQFIKYDRTNKKIIPLGKSIMTNIDESIYWVPNPSNGNLTKNIYFEVYVSLVNTKSKKILGKNKIKLMQYSNGKTYVK